MMLTDSHNPHNPHDGLGENHRHAIEKLNLLKNELYIATYLLSKDIPNWDTQSGMYARSMFDEGIEHLIKTVLDSPTKTPKEPEE
uniref:Uncharacterized protein n=1 Tax=Candidatus Kentrum sp. UNK TaxID=2126344 RepID=A0A451AQF8_9GAMM|nr:MAG: hypothetical protein BECKUNK1418G_GA0071005_100225 [Candidatus Kentron sp. UNK]VFK68266.1 MAG: hypothetical protein BECKUNK1418H_GA0071006_100125 [Candidatus Kentron sp. UNK]